MLLRQTLLYLPAQVVGPIFQLVSMVVWTHFLAPAELGIFALVSAGQELFHIATLFWFGLYTARYYDKTAPVEQHRAYLDTETAVMIGSSVATAAGVLLMPLVIDAPWNLELIVASIAFIVGRAVINQLSDRARTGHETVSYTILQIVWPVLGLVFGIALVKLNQASAAAVLEGYALAQLLSIAVAAPRLGIGWAPQRAARAMIYVAIKYALPLVVGGILVWIANNGIRFVVEWKEGAAAVGLITVGWGLGLRASAFAAMLVTAAAFPIAVTRAREQGIDAGQAQLVKNGVLLLAALAPAAAGLWVVADPLVKVFIAEPYREMTTAVLPLAIIAGALRNFRIHFGEQVFLLREQTTIPLANDAVDGATTLAGVAIGLWAGGLPGAVAGAAVGALVSLVVTLWCGFAWHRFTFPLGDFLRIGLAVWAMTLAVRILPLPPTLLGLCLSVAAGAVAYGAAMALLYPDRASRAISMLSGLVPRREGG